MNTLQGFIMYVGLAIISGVIFIGLTFQHRGLEEHDLTPTPIATPCEEDEALYYADEPTQPLVCINLEELQ